MQAFLKVKMKTKDRVFNPCSILIKNRRTFSKMAFYIEQDHKIQGSLTGTLPFYIHRRQGLWITILLFATERSQQGALHNYNASSETSLQIKLILIPKGSVHTSSLFL